MTIIARPRPDDAARPPRFPCLPRGDNAYAGCIGVGPCRHAGTPVCLFGRWAHAPYRTPGLLTDLPSSNGGARP